MNEFFEKLGNRNAHTDIMFFFILWIAFSPVGFIVTGGTGPAVVYLLMTSLLIVIDVEYGNSGLTLTPEGTR